MRTYLADGMAKRSVLCPECSYKLEWVTKLKIYYCTNCTMKVIMAQLLKMGPGILGVVQSAQKAGVVPPWPSSNATNFGMPMSINVGQQGQPGISGPAPPTMNDTFGNIIEEVKPIEPEPIPTSAYKSLCQECHNPVPYCTCRMGATDSDSVLSI